LGAFAHIRGDQDLLLKEIFGLQFDDRQPGDAGIRQNLSRRFTWSLTARHPVSSACRKM
jgi:hypothetical protein